MLELLGKESRWCNLQDFAKFDKTCSWNFRRIWVIISILHAGKYIHFAGQPRQEKNQFIKMQDFLNTNIYFNFFWQWHLILIGKIQMPWSDTGITTSSDGYRNETTLSTIAVFSMAFSFLNILRALVNFNVIFVHIWNMDSGKKITRLISIIMNHLVYFLSTTAFRVGSIALLYSYMNNYVALFIAIFWLANLFYGYKELAPVGAPYWLISFTSIFIPVYFIENTNNKYERTRIKEQQRNAFKFQSIACFFIYGSGLGMTWYYINFKEDWSYSSTMILDNIGFNIILVTCLIVGLISAMLSFQPDVFKALQNVYIYFKVLR